MVGSVQSPFSNSESKGRSTSSNLTSRAVVAFLLVALFLLQSYLIYSLFTSQIPSGNDFYSRWRGTRALLLEGKDPYSEEVTLEIQKGMFGRPARGDEDRVAFAYPLYVSLFILPLAFSAGLGYAIVATVILYLGLAQYLRSHGISSLITVR